MTPPPQPPPGGAAMEHKDPSELDRIPVYYSRPDLRPPRLNIITRDPQRATPGYILAAPSFSASSSYRPDSGPYIFDTNGTLIWSGADAAGATVHDLHICTYRAAPHLCYWQGLQRDTHGTGVGVILNRRYEVVSTTAPGGPLDFHEFHVLPETATALVMSYPPRFVEGRWVLDSCFAEVALNGGGGGGGSTLFEWCATDHIPLDEHPDFGSASARGTVPDRAWDYVHLNSVDKSAADGDYLVSARHLDTVYRVSGANGSIVWRLGGRRSDFEPAGEGFEGFARQHDARFRGGGSGSNNSSTVVVVSLFDNANDGVALKNNPSRARILQLDLEAKTVQQLSEYGRVPNSAGQDYVASKGMGNVQQLPNGNVLTTFGRYAAIAEYPPAGGEPIFYADMTAPSTLPTAYQWSVINYRAYLYLHNTTTTTTTTRTTDRPSTPWVGEPQQPPALWTYARTPTNLMTFYVSWNGATNVHTYRFWVSDSSPPTTDAFQLGGTWPKQGFETNYTIGSARQWSFAEALDAQGTSLANSSIVRTYVPDEADQKTCGKWHCFPKVANVEESKPIDGSAALGDGDGIKASGGTSPATLSVLEHVFALIGLGLCAYWVWGRVCNGRRDSKGYKRVEKDDLEEPIKV